jgi:hypothetical protein
MELDRLRGVDPINAEWVMGLVLLVLVVLAITNYGAARKWRSLGQAMFRMRLGRQALRDEIHLQDRTFLGLILASTVVISLFLWQLFVLRDPGAAPAFGFLLPAVVGILMVNVLVVHALRHLLNTDHGLLEHLHAGLLLLILTGLLLLPVVVLMVTGPAWRPLLERAGIATVSGLVLYRWVRGAWIGVGEGVPLRYIILYLCAAEMVPVLLLLRALH